MDTDIDPSEEYWAEMTSRRWTELKQLHPHKEEWSDEDNDTKDDLHGRLPGSS